MKRDYFSTTLFALAIVLVIWVVVYYLFLSESTSRTPSENDTSSGEETAPSGEETGEEPEGVEPPQNLDQDAIPF